MTGQIIEGFRCPICDEESLVYNGNYYCVNGDWAMSPEVPMREQPTWELELMVAYMEAENPDQFAIYINPLRAELDRRIAEYDYSAQFDEGDD